jgi:mono/diheme cytochrome c family protein
MATARPVPALAVFAALVLLASGIPAAKTGAAVKSDAPKVPAFAERSTIPSSGKQGPPGPAATLTGRAERGQALFGKRCESCHGPRGTDHVKNPGSDDGTVPPLNPIDPALTGKTPAAFAAKIDPYIQHGSIPDGPKPVLFMPNWGDSRTLNQQEIADVEAYIMGLNGVGR